MTAKAGTEVIVGALPNCDFCGMKAAYDAKTVMGPWANLCEKDFQAVGIGLGVGKGQRLVLKSDKPFTCPVCDLPSKDPNGHGH